MKKIIFMLLLTCAFVGTTVEKSNALVLKSDPPPELTWYCGSFYWPGSAGLPAGTYQVLSELYGDRSKVIYIYNQSTDTTYNCYFSTYDDTNNVAYLNVDVPSGNLGAIFL
ncbi:hypothetical protein [Pedobacter sp. ASV12]|uniref:hypothetical protein n=1 Tax=Pedobacter sp. ASV12 TaxID=2795120 RepID=UPI0018ED48FE|nr:hypothetical protein [Pedobacter sp. ASV12]